MAIVVSSHCAPGSLHREWGGGKREREGERKREGEGEREEEGGSGETQWLVQGVVFRV